MRPQSDGFGLRVSDISELRVLMKNHLIAKIGIFLLSLPTCYVGAQSLQPSARPPKDWWQLDLRQDSLPGISLRQAYDLLKGRPSQTVLVAVLDTPIDIAHEDLRDVIWTNERELAGERIDSDGNGYLNDLHGWCFVCSPEGKIVVGEQDEVTQITSMWRERFEGVNPLELDPDDRRDYALYQQAKQETLKQRAYFGQLKEALVDSVTLMGQLDKWTDYFSKNTFNKHSVALIKAKKTDEIKAKAWLEYLLSLGGSSQLDYPTVLLLTQNRRKSFYDRVANLADQGYNPDWQPRKVVGDDPGYGIERFYGAPAARPDNMAVFGHGTHVAGIIGAKRGNGLGIDGVADNVRIMSLAVASGGDERDKDIANAIRYAVNAGAKVINMSFAKRLSPHKTVLDDAILYAERKGVLLFNAAANDANDNDTTAYYPVATYQNGTKASNFIEVGNSTAYYNENLAAASSNYGQRSVDVFAPGSMIYATVPSSRYDYKSGTSMASPCAAGVAALLWSYFPKLTAQQVKALLLDTALRPGVQVYRPGSRQLVPFAQLSATGGIVNAYEAVKKALEWER